MCDVKGCYEQMDSDEWYSKLARRVARDQGWRRSHGKDICPAHEHESFASLSFN